MRRHAKASTAGTNQRRAKGLGRPLRGVLAALAALLAMAALAPAAGATLYQRPLKETFGPAEQPTFDRGQYISIDRGTNDVLVGAEGGYQASGKIYRYHADGTPAPFAALGTNTLDGKAGPGGKPCAEEPASCDQTPQNKLELYSSQIAIDHSGTSTDGNIYVAEGQQSLIDIFSSEGRYLGQLTAAGFEPFHGSVCGVTVDGSGAVYVASGGHTITKYVPGGAVPVDSDFVTNFEPEQARQFLCKLAAGEGPSAGSLFAAYWGQDNSKRVGKINEATGESSDFVGGYGTEIAVDPTTGNLIAQRIAHDPLESEFPSGHELAEFAGSGETAGPALSRTVVETGGIYEFAVDNSGNLDVAVQHSGEPSDVRTYGLPATVPTPEVNLPANITGKTAVLTGTVNPAGVAVTECYFEYGPVNSGGFASYTDTVPCEGAIPTDSSDHAVHASITGLTPNAKKYAVRLAARNENGTERSTPKPFATAYTVATDPATELSRTSATLNGTVLPEGLEYSECFFEWGLNSTPGYEHKAPCYPPAPAIEPSASSQAVSAAIGGLTQNTLYHFRLVATNSEGTHSGDELTFTTLGLPQFSEIRARDAGQSSVVLEAKINPSGSGTSYHFEWGAGSSYGNEVPTGYEPFVGSGTEPVKVTAKLSGLAAAGAYHYRVVATNAVGTAASADQEAETLNSCGLPDGRCFELVSPRDAGPIAVPGENRTGAELQYQAAPSGPGALAYIVESGFPDATAGAELLYLSRRGISGWGAPTQLKPPINAADERQGGSGSGSVLALNDEMTCGVVESFMPLTDDPGALETRENGGSNLYRTGTSDGSYQILTKLPPDNGLIKKYNVRGVSQDCNTVVFDTEAVYPGISGEGKSRLYEWRNGVLRNLGVVPGPGEEEAVTEAGEPGGDRNAVSDDGSRAFFQAKRKTSPIAAEIGKQGVFVREDGEVTRDLSLSQTATADSGANFQWATRDGLRVFFTANAGLTGESSPTGTDLYEYDLESETLTDRSVNPESGGAQVQGFVAASSDGSRVYFTARGKLVPGKGKGKTLAENETDGTYSLYSEVGGATSFVGTVGSGTTIGGASRTTPDGRYLVFETSENVTGYESGSASALEAYLYDAQGGSNGTVCVSCRQDGLPSVVSTYVSFSPPGPLANDALNPLHPLSSLAERGGDPIVFFTSPDQLAPGAVDGGTEGGLNLYEWAHGQVYLVDIEMPGAAEPKERVFGLSFDGGSDDGSDLYFTTKRSLTWEDGDERGSVYDARIGGGFPEPPPPPTPCNADSEGSCQSSQSQGGSNPSAASNSFNGSGNVKEAAGGGANRCARSARQAKSLSARAKRLARNARKVNRKDHRRAVKLNRKAHRLAKRAKGLSAQAKRCRKRQRANNDRRAGK